MERLAWIGPGCFVVAIAIVVLHGRGDAAHAREIAAADSIKDAALDSLVVVRERADSLTAEAARSDTVLVRVVDSVTVVVEHADHQAALADTAFSNRTDSLRFHLRVQGDTAGVALLDRIAVDHEATLTAGREAREALAVRLAATEANAALWRTTAEGQEHRAETAEAALSAAEAAIAVRDDALAARSRRAWYERGVAVAAIALAVLR